MIYKGSKKDSSAIKDEAMFKTRILPHRLCWTDKLSKVSYSFVLFVMEMKRWAH